MRSSRQLGQMSDRLVESRDHALVGAAAAEDEEAAPAFAARALERRDRALVAELAQDRHRGGAILAALELEQIEAEGLHPVDLLAVTLLVGQLAGAQAD